MNNYIPSLCELLNLKYVSSHAISGGDINSSFAVDTVKGRYFLKLNMAARFPGMFAKEAEGLRILGDSCKLKVPQVVFSGVHQNQQYLLVEWLEKSPPPQGFWNEFAEGLAELHKTTHNKFGWKSSNYIGTLVQENDYAANWGEFYATQRILPLVRQLYNKGLFDQQDLRASEKVCSRLHEVFPPEPPALLHGDLWAGNLMSVNIGGKKECVVKPSVFDPAAYYGHREMDLGMSLLFGGFDSNFYNDYNSLYPLEINWRKRVLLTQLYPLLVHAILFGGSYFFKCRNILKEWS